MKFNLTTRHLRLGAVMCLILGILIALWILFLGGYLTGTPYPDAAKARELQPFFTGIVAPLLTLGATLLVLVNLRTTTEQNFSTNFFKLIDLHNKLTEGITTTIDGVSTDERPSRGKGFFDDLCYRIANDYYSIRWHNPGSGYTLLVDNDLRESAKDKVGKALLLDIYDYYFSIYQSDLGHYFRNLYHIVRFAEKSVVSQELRVSHLKILRSQLSNYELLLLAYNGIHEYGTKFFPLIEKYDLLKGLNSENSLTRSRVKRIVDFDIILEAYPNYSKNFE